jgi:hypothetical protein
MSSSNRAALLALDDAALLAQCELDRFRGSGKGGQKRNKTSSAVRLRHRPTGLIGLASDSRSQSENRDRALRRLREAFGFELREEVDLDDYQPAPALARLAGPLVKNERFQRSAEYLAAVGALLDLYRALGCSLADAATRAGLPLAGLRKWIDADRRLARRLAELKQARHKLLP